jgi:hypothetical protein
MKNVTEKRRCLNWYKCGKILAPLMRQQMAYIAWWSAFGITDETAEKLKKISPASIDRYLKKDKETLKLKGKSLTKPLASLKSRIPIHTFYTSGERKKPGFWQIDTADFSPTPLRAGHSRPVPAYSDRHQCCLGLD